MAIDYTTTELVKSLKRRGSVPTSQSLFLPADFVALMNDEMHSTVIPEIHAVNEEYFVTAKDTTIVANQANYRLPTRAIGGGVRDVVLVDSDGQERPLTRLQPDDVKYTGDSIQGFYLKDDQIVLVPTPTSANGDSLRVKFERRPNNLVLESAATRITSINLATNEVTVSNMPSTWTASTTVDIIQATPTFASIVDDQTLSGIAGNTLTLPSLPTGIAVGQWVCEAGTSPIPQLPYEAHFIIAQLGAAKCLEALKDNEGMKSAHDKAMIMMSQFLKLIAPRSGGSAEKITNRGGLWR